MVDVEGILRPYYERLVADAGGLALYDAHTHVGANDPDGFRQTPEQLLDVLAKADARATVFPMHEPDGYRAPNDAVIEAAAASDGRLVPYCRVNPHDGALAEAERALDAGARGIKLHPRAEQFALGEPAVRDLIALAHERSLPVLIHAGRGIPALGRDTVRLSGEFTDAKLILAHAAISDLAWLWKVMPEHPNLFIDTAWWNPSDLLALFALAPPSQILWASDSPYGLPVMSAMMALRCAVQAGLGPDALRLIAGGQLERILARQPPADAGPPPGPAQAPLDPLLERVVTHLVAAMARAFARTDPDESVALARLSCAVGEDDAHAPVFAAVLEMLDRYAEFRHVPPSDGRPIPPAGRFLVSALVVARTPDVPLPHVPAPPPTRESAGDS
ncbi:MAG: uncharacterized protein QOE28_2328 [Solirubrobacteraceae bacterium]|jgi:predicted TIM-barrel fold metal-dependent hydrolase|nr:uncharacterized protein [Solirubrobacteraceae bacterium]